MVVIEWNRLIPLCLIMGISSFLFSLWIVLHQNPNATDEGLSYNKHLEDLTMILHILIVGIVILTFVGCGLASILKLISTCS